MAANLFSRLERFREKSQVMGDHWSWSIALDDEWLLSTHSLSQTVSQSVTYVGIELLRQLKKINP